MLLSKTIALLGPQHKTVLIKLAYNDQEKEREYLVSSDEDDSNAPSSDEKDNFDSLFDDRYIIGAVNLTRSDDSSNE